MVAAAALAGIVLSSAWAGVGLGPATVKLSGQYAVYGLTVVLIVALSRSRGFMAAALGNRVAVYLGDVSYALYLSHIPALHAFRTLSGGSPQQLVVELAVVLAVATALHHAVEKPARDALRTWTDRAVARPRPA